MNKFWGKEDIEGAGEGATGVDAEMTSLTAESAEVVAEAEASAVDTTEIVAAGGAADGLAATGELLESTLAEGGEGASPVMADSVNAALEALQNSMKLPVEMRTRLSLESNATVAERRKATQHCIESIAETGKAYWARFLAWVKAKWADFKAWAERTFSYLDRASKAAVAFKSRVSTMDGSTKESVKSGKIAAKMDYYGDMTAFLKTTGEKIKAALGMVDQDMKEGKILPLNDKAKLKLTGSDEGSGAASIEVSPVKSEKKEAAALSVAEIKALAAAAVDFATTLKGFRSEMRAYESTVNASIKEIQKAAGTDDAAKAAAKTSAAAERAKIGNMTAGTQAMLKYGVAVLNDALAIGHASFKLYKPE